LPCLALPPTQVCQRRAHQAWDHAFQAWKWAKPAWTLLNATLKGPGTAPPPLRKAPTATRFKTQDCLALPCLASSTPGPPPGSPAYNLSSICAWGGGKLTQWVFCPSGVDPNHGLLKRESSGVRMTMPLESPGPKRSRSLHQRRWRAMGGK